MKDRCEKCHKIFDATPENSVDLKVRVLGMPFYQTVCKDCAEKMAANGEIRVLREGGVKLLQNLQRELME